MTKRSSTPAGAVLVAIDMAKNRQEVLIERPEGGHRRRQMNVAEDMISRGSVLPANYVLNGSKLLPINLEKSSKFYRAILPAHGRSFGR